MPQQPKPLDMRLFQGPNGQPTNAMIERNNLMDIIFELDNNGQVQVIPSKQATWQRLENLTVGDLWGLLGFYHEKDPKQGPEYRQQSQRVRGLKTEDAYDLGDVLAKWRSVDGALVRYPPGVYSCCCCADFDD